MSHDFDFILDCCIDRLNQDESLERILSDYPQYADQLAPLLEAMSRTQNAFSFTPSADCQRSARARFYAALDRRRKPSLWRRLILSPVAWAGLVAVLAVIIIGVVGLRPALAPQQPVFVSIPGPSPEGNFAFLVSDEVNAIDDFSQLMVTIDKVSLLKSSGESAWVEFTPETPEFDLSLLPGEKSQEIWRGDLPEGDYTKVIIYVSHVSGILKATQETIDIKLPSNKLQMSHSFNISAGQVTSFVFDLTVVHAGNAKNGGKYILKPQIGESGASQKPAETKKAPANPDRGNPENNNPGQNNSGQDKSNGKKDTAFPDTLTPFLVSSIRNTKFI